MAMVFFILFRFLFVTVFLAPLVQYFHATSRWTKELTVDENSRGVEDAMVAHWDGERPRRGRGNGDALAGEII